jgi:uncharacterized membrane protein YkvA (DUF1232 family)
MSSSIHEFVLRGGQTVTAGQMNDFRRQVPFLQVKAETLETTNFPHLAEQTRFLARYAEDVLDGVYTSGNLVAITETIFALGYLLKDVDIIPDTVPGQGLADDSAVLRAVLSSHDEEFQAYAEANKIDFKKVTSAA